MQSNFKKDFSPFLLDFFGRLLFVDWVLTDGSMSLFVHFFNLRERLNLRSRLGTCLLLPKLEALTFQIKLVTFRSNLLSQTCTIFIKKNYLEDFWFKESAFPYANSKESLHASI